MDMLCKSQEWLQEYRKWHSHTKSSTQTSPQKWEKLGVGWMKCNFDGAWDELGEVRGICVVIQDKNESFVAATTINFIGVSSTVLAESLAASASVLFARNLGMVQLEVQGDAMLVVNALQSDTATLAHGSFGNVLNDARQVLKSFQSWKVTFGRRETNKIAHRLARLGLSLDDQIV